MKTNLKTALEMVQDAIDVADEQSLDAAHRFIVTASTQSTLPWQKDFFEKITAAIAAREKWLDIEAAENPTQRRFGIPTDIGAALEKLLAAITAVAPEDAADTGIALAHIGTEGLIPKTVLLASVQALQDRANAHVSIALSTSDEAVRQRLGIPRAAWAQHNA